MPAAAGACAVGPAEPAVRAARCWWSPCALLVLAAVAVGGPRPRHRRLRRCPPAEVLQALAGEGTRAAGWWSSSGGCRGSCSRCCSARRSALSGAIFQSLTRNPLGSPDIIGFNTGAYTGVLVVILVFVGRGYYQIAAGALVGGLATAVARLPARLRGGRAGLPADHRRHRGQRRARLGQHVVHHQGRPADRDGRRDLGAGQPQRARLGPGHARSPSPSACCCLAAGRARAAAGAARAGRRRRGGARRPGGARPGSRTSSSGVALTAVVTAAAGPIAFVALAAPQLARRLTRTARIALVPSAAMGALLLVAQRLARAAAFAPTQLPVGVVTVSLGGVYLVWLLVRAGASDE